MIGAIEKNGDGMTAFCRVSPPSFILCAAFPAFARWLCRSKDKTCIVRAERSIFAGSHAFLENGSCKYFFGNRKKCIKTQDEMQIVQDFCAKTLLVKLLLHYGGQRHIVRARKAERFADDMKEVFGMLTVIGLCGAVYLAGMVYMTVAGMKE